MREAFDDCLADNGRLNREVVALRSTRDADITRAIALTIHQASAYISPRTKFAEVVSDVLAQLKEQKQ